ncbi:hypothetical protein FHS60_000336 [Alloprevotella rava]|uniref:Uncharacterized protein n=1 Tax=Alloprevotella rava TaxID=671218 RepID=A0A7W5UD86_9BACT|nr:hypothetical protein [Alloprevotella rava]
MSGTSVCVAGKPVIDVIFSQPEKASLSIEVTVLGMTIFPAKALQSLKVLSSIFVTPSGMEIEVSPVLWNAPFPMVLTVEGILKDVNLSQLLTKPSGMQVTPSGKDIDIRLSQLEKAALDDSEIAIGFKNVTEVKLVPIKELAPSSLKLCGKVKEPVILGL